LFGLSALAFAAVGVQPPAVPNNLKVPDCHTVLLKAQGQGVQIYTCGAKAGDRSSGMIEDVNSSSREAKFWRVRDRQDVAQALNDRRLRRTMLAQRDQTGTRQGGLEPHLFLLEVRNLTKIS
jgi:hypothetical protein